MSNAMEILAVTPELLETITATFSTDAEKALARQIVALFLDNGLPVKGKQYSQPCMKGTFRILCFIRKSAEAVIINNKGMGHEGVSFQVRIEDRSLFDDLDSLSSPIRTQILHARDCVHCSAGCEPQKYRFTYAGKDYIKCRFLCNNFIFENLTDAENTELLQILRREINWRQRQKKKSPPAGE